MNKIQDYKEAILSIDDLLTNILYFTGHDYDEIEINELRIYYNGEVKKMLNFVYRYNDKCHQTNVGAFTIPILEIFDDNFPECYFERLKEEEEEKNRQNEYRKKECRKQQYKRYLELKAQFEREPFEEEE